MSATTPPDVQHWGPRPDLAAGDHGHGHGSDLDAGVEQLAMKGPKSGQARMRTAQQRYERVLRGRFAAVSAEIRRGVQERDIFGLSVEEQLASDFSPEDLNPSAYRYLDPPQQHDRFMDWLNRQQENGVLEVIDRDENIYVRDATRDGVRLAQRELREAGLDVPTGLDEAFNQSIDARQLNLLYQRNYELLDGITSDVSKEISRVLTDGFEQGQNPREIARSLTGRVSAIGKTRAEHMARYEVMNAHNTGAIARYEDAGVGQVEILTSDPCDSCAAIKANGPYSLEEARGLVPDHPSCVCTVSPLFGG